MQKTILYAVLNWGLGHATRSIPIIKFLLEEGHRLIVASDGLALTLLQKEFPRLEFEETSAYDVVYASSSAQFNIKLATQIPKFVKAIKEEQEDCSRLCEDHEVDYIISDNRYGFYHKTIPSAFVCHQLHLLYPSSSIAEKIINKSYQGYLKKFTQLWVPDIAPPNNVSNKLSALNWNNVVYIGLSSRFIKQTLPKKYDYIAILSGPEPQRTILEKELREKLQKKKGKHCIVRGTNDTNEFRSIKNIETVDLLESEALNTLMCQSETIICRSGYTSVVDLLKLGANAILIPTPGQAEQEYLGDELARKKWFTVQQQDAIELKVLSKQKRASLSFGYDENAIQLFLSCSVS